MSVKEQHKQVGQNKKVSIQNELQPRRDIKGNRKRVYMFIRSGRKMKDIIGPLCNVKDEEIIEAEMFNNVFCFSLQK